MHCKAEDYKTLYVAFMYGWLVHVEPGFYAVQHQLVSYCVSFQPHNSSRGVSNNLKFHRSLLKLFLKIEIWPEILVYVKYESWTINQQISWKLSEFYRNKNFWNHMEKSLNGLIIFTEKFELKYFWKMKYGA